MGRPLTQAKPTTRKHIPLLTKLASALSMLLTQEERDQLRSRRASPKEVLQRFDFHHGAFHSLTKDDHWANLTPLLREAHKTRTPSDIRAIAKTKRLETEFDDFRRRVLSPVKTKRKTVSKWPKRKLQSRGFSKRRKP